MTKGLYDTLQRAVSDAARSGMRKVQILRNLKDMAEKVERMADVEEVS